MVVDTLASESMKGRGYVDQGVDKAATFIAQEFERLGLQKLSESYFQEFESPVNTFPDNVKLSINGVRLTPGIDFLIEPGSPGITGSYSIQRLTYIDLLDEEQWVQKVRNSTGKVLFIDGRGQREFDKKEKKSN